MYNLYRTYPYSCYANTSMCNFCRTYSCPYCVNSPASNLGFSRQYNTYDDEMEYDSSSSLFRHSENDDSIKLRDYGPEPFVVNINEAAKQNDNFRTALWTGPHLQLTLMSINVGEDIGLEIHPHLDQFLRIEEGQGIVKMGNSRNNLDFQRKVYDDFAIFIPAGTWHNLINTGNKPIKLYSIYAPPQHPRGTVHETKAIAQAAENH